MTEKVVSTSVKYVTKPTVSTIEQRCPLEVIVLMDKSVS